MLHKRGIGHLRGRRGDLESRDGCTGNMRCHAECACTTLWADAMVGGDGLWCRKHSPNWKTMVYGLPLNEEESETAVLRLNETKASGAHNRSRIDYVRRSAFTREQRRIRGKKRSTREREKGTKERGVKNEKPCSKQEAWNGACGKSSIRYALGHAALF